MVIEQLNTLIFCTKNIFVFVNKNILFRNPIEKCFQKFLNLELSQQLSKQTFVASLRNSFFFKQESGKQTI